MGGVDHVDFLWAGNGTRVALRNRRRWLSLIVYNFGRVRVRMVMVGRGEIRSEAQRPMRRIMSPKFSPAVTRSISVHRAGLMMLKVSPMPQRTASFAMLA